MRGSEGSAVEDGHARPIIFVCILHATLNSMSSDPPCIYNSCQWSSGIQSPKPPRAF